MTQEEILDRIEKVAVANQYSQILDQLICEEIDTLRKEIAEEAGPRGGPCTANPNRAYCKPDQSCCDFVCGN